MADILTKKAERAKLIKQARTLLDTAEKDKRNLTAEENTQYEKIMVDVDAIADLITKEERQATLDKEMAATDEIKELRDSNNEKENRSYFASQEYSDVFSRVLRNGTNSITQKEHERIQKESRALQMDIDTAGGYLIPPVQFVKEIIKAKDNQVFFRGLARTFQVPNAESLGAPSLDADPADPTWVAELKIGTEDSTMAFGKRELKPHPMAQFIKVSNKLLRADTMGAESLVRGRLAYKMSVVEESAFMTGTGVQQPLGIFTASNDGISTSYDVSTGNTSTEIRTDGLIEAKYSIKPQYWPNLKWIFNREAVKIIRKLKDGEGQYIWQPGITAGAPDVILNAPVLMSEYAPHVFTASQYVGIIGDFSYYWIADALDMTIQRLVELYAATNQVGFISRSETDGMPVLGEAFARVKLST